MKKYKSEIIIFSFLFLIIIFLFIIYHFFIFKIIPNAQIDFESKEILSPLKSRVVNIHVVKNMLIDKKQLVMELDKTQQEDELQKIQEEYIETNKIHQELAQNTTEIKNKNLELKKEIEQAKMQLDSANSDFVKFENAYKDGTITKNDLKKAQDNLYTARKNYSEALFKLQFSTSKLDDSKKNSNTKNKEVEEIKSKLESIQKEIDSASIFAPIDGTINNIFVKIDDDVDLNQKLFKITSDKIKITFDSKKAKKIKENKKVTIFLDNKEKISGKIIQITQYDNKTTLIIKSEKPINPTKENYTSKIQIKR